MVAETDAGRHRDLGIAQQFLGELQRPHMQIGFRYRRPDKHGRLRLLHRPAGGIQTVAKHVTAALVHVTDLTDAFLRPLERGDRRHLNGCEHAIVEIGLDTCQRRHQGLVAAHETDPPARHVIALGEREKLHRNFFRTGHLQDRRCLVAVVHDVRVGQIVHYPDVVAPRDIDHLLKKFQVHALGGRIRRKADHQHLGARPGIDDRLLQLGEKIHPRYQRHMAYVRTGDHETVRVNRVGRVRHQHRIARPQAGQCQVGQPLLGTDGDDGLGLRIQAHLITFLVPVADGPSQAGYALRHGIAVGVLALRHLHQFGNDMRRSRLIRITHTEIDDVFSARPRRRLQFIDDVEDIRRQALDSVEIFHLWCGHDDLPRQRREKTVKLTDGWRLCQKKRADMLTGAAPRCRSDNRRPTAFCLHQGQLLSWQHEVCSR